MTGLHLVGISRERPIVCLHYRLAQPVDPAANARASREKVSLPMRRSSPAVELRYAREACARSRRRSLPLGTEAVAQTPGELAGSFLRVGSERGHLLRRTQRVSRPVVPHDSPGVYFRERGAAFPKWLCATASPRAAEVDHKPDEALAAREAVASFKFPPGALRQKALPS